MATPQKIIVFRFSAMGDVAMVASVLKEFKEIYPETEIILVSREPFKAFFDNIPNIIFHAIQPKTIHKGVPGLFRLYKTLLKYKPDAIADLHDNLRSRMLSAFFRLSGIKIERLDKGRKEKKALTRSQNKILIPLKQTVERYADVFRSLGFPFKLKHQLEAHPGSLPEKAKVLFLNPDTKKIGVSPFAQHIYKVYPPDRMLKVLLALAGAGYEIFVFGGGKTEKDLAQNWAEKHSHIHNLIGSFNLSEELSVISNLDLMLSMDSAGMHMASLVGVPVVSLWGPTHPYAGFLGYGQSINDCIQIDHPDRPNSIYGNKPCLCGVQNCMEMISPESIVDKIKERIKNG